MPLVSIITPVLNCGRMVENYIRHIHAQTYERIELLIIDGGSSDDTITILKLSDAKINFWVSAPDNGIYDAMNKGIDMARGDWLFFSGVDDSFIHPEILETVFLNSEIPDCIQLICGNIIRSDGKKITSRFNRQLYMKNTMPHQGVFYRRDLFDHYRYTGSGKHGPGRFYQISGDYHLNLFLYRCGARHQYIDLTIMQCGQGKSMAGNFRGYWEEILIRHQLLGHTTSILFDGLTLLRYLRQRCRPKLTVEKR